MGVKPDPNSPIREVSMGFRDYRLMTPSTVGEYPPMTEKPRALVLFFDTPEQCTAWEKFLSDMPPRPLAERKKYWRRRKFWFDNSDLQFECQDRWGDHRGGRVYQRIHMRLDRLRHAAQERHAIINPWQGQSLYDWKDFRP